MQSGIVVNILQAIFAIYTVATIPDQKPAEFLNSCLFIFAIITIGLIGFSYAFIKNLNVEHLYIGRQKRRGSILQE